MRLDVMILGENRGKADCHQNVGNPREVVECGCSGSVMRLKAIVLPDLGTGVDEPIVVSHWFAARGDRIWEGDRLVEVLVGPATFDVPAPRSGRLAEIHRHEDDRIDPGGILGLVAVTDEDEAPLDPNVPAEP